MDEREPKCASLCGASKAYGKFDKPWKHEPQCPVRIAWEQERASRPSDEGASSGADMETIGF